MTTTYPNIHLLSDHALTLLPSGFHWKNPTCVDMLRVNPEECDRSEMPGFLREQLTQYPGRVLRTLRAEHDSETSDTNSIFALGLSALNIAENAPAATVMRQLFDSTRQSGASDGLEIFEQYAKKLVQGILGGDSMTQIQNVVRTSSATITSELLYKRNQMLEGALEEIPKELCEAVNRLGARIVISSRNSEHFANGTIYLDNRALDGTYDFETPLLKTASVLKEEMVHYVDKFLGFTQRPEWQAVYRNNSGTSEVAPEIRALLDNLSTINPDELTPEQANALIATLEQDIRDGVTSSAGKKSNTAYETHKQATELLPDIFHALDELAKQGHAPDKALTLAENIYGADAMQLVNQFSEEVKQVANGTHPRLNKVVSSGLAFSEISTTGGQPDMSAPAKRASVKRAPTSPRSL